MGFLLIYINKYVCECAYMYVRACVRAQAHVINTMIRKKSFKQMKIQ